ncbi:hypothetical protein BDP27DRAFT_1314400 [Rhodocollybia butyracea]|uniref:Yeast cell wall synthesis Kre9/Knh1-like N-terminal domain-containing protein n=1 Tax=Rhodocollybia butyracea TaxID=206335 RepID=A0A9P5UE10_9AGAR|nr:hypothetical protein BDP27DRAFT_1314400 [Rhodocollybia butyracea]
MQRFYPSLIAVLFSAVTLVIGDGVTPTSPGPGDKFEAGSPCTIEWKVGQNWSNFSIYLMSGSNDQMNAITIVASGLDGSNASLSPFTWTCPEVNPYGAIYFYQLTNGNDTANSTWTTRFTITSRSGDFVPPAHSTQPNGDPIPWGIGSLASASASTTETSTNEDSTPTSSTSTSTTKKTSSALILTAAPHSQSSSSRMKTVKTTNTDRQATPTLNLPSSATTTIIQMTDATQATGTPVNSRPSNSGNGLRTQSILGVWGILLALVLVSS